MALRNRLSESTIRDYADALTRLGLELGTLDDVETTAKAISALKGHRLESCTSAYRHYKATTTYLKTKDILHVKNILGHKRITTTMKYIHLVEQMFPEGQEYVCKVAENLKEATKLIEQGFEYVAEFEGKMLFRKLKLP